MLTSSARQGLKAKAHHLKPVVLLGARGVSPSVLAELDRALEDHELIKVQLPPLDREEREACIAELVNANGAEIIGRIGRVLILYRSRSDSPKPSSTNHP